MSAAELAAVVAAVRQRPGCRLLVFGLGNDSPFWAAVNRRGRTVFLEDDPAWREAVCRRHPELIARQVRYGTRLPEWRELLGRPAELEMSLPEGVGFGEWDVVLVDGPAGWADSTPGRMKSIYAAARLAASGGDVFVHDCDRPAECAYSDRYLTAPRLVATVGKLRHYRMIPVADPVSGVA